MRCRVGWTLLASLDERLSASGRGARLTTAAKTDLFITDDPQTLADRANMTLDGYTLARVIASEGYGGRAGRAYASLAIAQAIQNLAKRDGSSVTELALSGHGGRYGRQRGNRPPFATYLDPREGDREIVALMFGGFAPRLVRRAHSFVDPRALGGDLDEKLRRRVSWGWSWAGEVPGVDPQHLAFFEERDGGQASMDDLREQIELSRRGERGAWPAPQDVPPLFVASAIVALKGIGIL